MPKKSPSQAGSSPHDYFTGGQYIILDQLEDPSPSIHPGPADLEKEEGELIEEGDSNNQQEWGPPAEADASNPFEQMDVQDAPWGAPDQPDSACYALSTPGLVAAIRSEGIAAHQKNSSPEWIRRTRGYSLHLLHDGMLSNWPEQDNKCGVDMLPRRRTEWVPTIRGGGIFFRGHVVALALSSLRELEALTPLKNHISSLTRAIRAVKRQDTRVFICNTLVGRNRVLGLTDQKYNELLREAVLSIRVSHKLTRVHVADVAQQFFRLVATSSRPAITRPIPIHNRAANQARLHAFQGTDIPRSGHHSSGPERIDTWGKL